MTFTAWDRGFWAPRSMLVSIPKAACEERKLKSNLKTQGRAHPHRDWHMHLETWALGWTTHT